MQKGFTLIETLIVIALVMILSISGYFITFPMLKSQIVKNNAELIISQLSLAQTEAYSQLDNQSHGIKLTSGTITRFSGDSFAERDIAKDIITIISDSIVYSGDTECIFTKGSIIPNNQVYISLTSGITTYDLSVTSYGSIQIAKRLP